MRGADVRRIEYVATQMGEVSHVSDDQSGIECGDLRRGDKNEQQSSLLQAGRVCCFPNAVFRLRRARVVHQADFSIFV